MKTTNIFPQVCIIGSNHLQSELLSFCLHNELNAKCVINRELPSDGFQGSEGRKPVVWLFDCLEYRTDELEKQFCNFAAIKTNGNLIALFNVTSDDHPVRFVTQYRVRGIFYKNDSRDIFIKGIRKMLDGQLWLSRKMLSDCIQLASEKRTNQPVNEIEVLSSRERVVLQNVASGASNQEIADNLDISVHTVKTHLYKIYRKIDVPNRLQATLWAANACDNALAN